MRLRYNVRYYQDGQWIMADIPDLGEDGVLAQGKTLAEAHTMAIDAVTQMLLAEFDLGREPIVPSTTPRPGYEWVYPNIKVETALLIRQKRKQQGLTMQRAARALGVKLSTYQKWEDPATCNATVETLDKIAQAFGLHAEIALC